VAVMEENKEKKSSGAKRVVITIVCIILALILVLTACVGAYVSYLLGKIDRVTNEQTIDPDKLDQIIGSDPDLSPLDPSESLPNLDDITIPSEGKDPSKNPDHVINILLIGQDETIPGVRARSDSMILVTVNARAKSVTFTSFMRDSYVQIPGYKPHKLCHAFQYGGMSLLSKTLNVNFGVEVDGAISVDFSQFEQIIDYLGGVDIKLTQKEADFMNNEYGLSVEPGMQRLTGKEALCYSRIRKIDTDYRRAGRQRKVLLSLVERYKSLTVEEMLDMLEAVLPMITTNIPKEKIVPLAMELFPMLGTCEFKNQQIPAEGTFIGGDVKVRPGLKNWFEYNIDFEENRRILQEIFDAD
jgi:LCP family protein required for cell wall assembly